MRAPPAEIRALTGLRGLAALDVAIAHLGGWRSPALQPLIFNNAAVDVFFCLSSFTLCLVYDAGQPGRLMLRPYLAARFARIYPLYLASTLAMLVIGLAGRSAAFAAAGPWTLARQFAQQASLLGAWPLPGFSGFWNPPAWSISAEAFCYALVFPLLHAASRQAARLPPALPGAAMLLAALGAVAMYLAHYDSTVNEIGFPPPADPLAYATALVRAVAMALAGWCAFLLWRGGGAAARLAARGADGLALGFLAVVAGGWWFGWPAQWAVLCAPPLILGLASPGSAAARLLGWRGPHELGRLSYAIYLLHWPIGAVCWHVSGLVRHSTAWGILIPLALTLPAALASTRWFEQPMRAALRLWLGARRAATLR